MASVNDELRCRRYVPAWNDPTSRSLVYQSHTEALLMTPASAITFPMPAVLVPSGISTRTSSPGSPDGSISPWTHDQANQPATAAASASTASTARKMAQPRRRGRSSSP